MADPDPFLFWMALLCLSAVLLLLALNWWVMRD
jgi:hypothetical protein